MYYFSKGYVISALGNINYATHEFNWNGYFGGSTGNKCNYKELFDALKLYKLKLKLLVINANNSLLMKYLSKTTFAAGG